MLFCFYSEREMDKFWNCCRMFLLVNGWEEGID